MFPRNQRSKPTFRKNTEHYVAYNALYVMILLVVCINHIQAKICVISEQTAITWPQKIDILILIG